MERPVHRDNISRVTAHDSRNLDLLRAVAILAVFASHLRAPLAVSDPLFHLGRFGVLIFFVHTSRVLMGSMERLVAKGGGWVRSFYLRRAFRIYPLSIATVLVAAVWHLPRVPHEAFVPFTPARLLANLALAQNLTRHQDAIGTLWSLPFEVQMYLVLPLCFIATRAVSWQRGAWLWCAAAGSVVLLGAASHHATDIVLAYVPCFLAGVWLWTRRGHAAQWPAWAWPVLLVSIGAVYCAIDQPTGSLAARLRLDWLVCLAIAAACSLCAEPSASLLYTGAHRLVTYSYGIYLAHLPILTWVFFSPHDWSTGTRLLFATVLLLTLPVVLYRVLEEPMIVVGARVAARLQFGAAHVPTSAEGTPALN